MWLHSFWFLALALAFLSLPALSYAQDTPAEEIVVEEEKAKDPKSHKIEEVPDEYIAEAYQFHGKCKSTPQMSQYYNCDCLAAKYLDARIELGPDAPANAVVLAIDGECPDATEAAGVQYTQCMRNGPLMPRDIPLKQFCECVGNTYAKLYERYKLAPSSKVFQRIQRESMVACRDPNLAKRIFPYMDIE